MEIESFPESSYLEEQRDIGTFNKSCRPPSVVALAPQNDSVIQQLSLNLRLPYLYFNSNQEIDQYVRRSDYYVQPICFGVVKEGGEEGGE